MKRGKQTCRILKEIRRQIAEANDIEFVTSECRFREDCPGTCPKCEAEVRYLEQQLKRRQAAGKVVTLIGLSAGVMTMNARTDLFETAKEARQPLTEWDMRLYADSLITVTGNVKDTSGFPMHQAYICERDTANAVFTDSLGNFRIKVSGKHPLVIQYIGMRMQEIEIDEKKATCLQIILQDDEILMGEIGVMGDSVPSDF